MPMTADQRADLAARVARRIRAATTIAAMWQTFRDEVVLRSIESAIREHALSKDEVTFYIEQHHRAFMGGAAAFLELTTRLASPAIEESDAVELLEGMHVEVREYAAGLKTLADEDDA